MTTTALALRPADAPEFERTATYMAHEFSQAMAQIAQAFGAMTAATERLDAAFRAASDDLVKQLNGLAAGEYVLGEDVDA